jgi:hypothetical protein
MQFVLFKYKEQTELTTVPTNLQNNACMPVTDIWCFEEYADETTVFELFDHKHFNSSVF